MVQKNLFVIHLPVINEIVCRYKQKSCAITTHILHQTNKKAAESENTLFQDSLSAAFSLSAGNHKESPNTEII